MRREAGGPITQLTRAQERLLGQSARVVHGRRAAASGLCAALLFAQGCYVPAVSTALAPRTTVRLTSPEPFPVYQETATGFGLACRARSVEGAVETVRGDSVEFRSLWVRESVRDGARCHTGIASIVVVSEVRGTAAPLSRRSAWRTLGAAALAIPLMLIAVIVVVCESSVTSCQS